MAAAPSTRAPSVMRRFLDNQASGGLVLMAAAALALLAANSPLAAGYEAALHAYLGPLSVQHWINDGLMAVFFLVVGLEIKREVLDGQLSTWPRRVLPAFAAAAGMAVPGLIYVALNWDRPELLRGWAIPAATDIAFALGVISLLGSRVPASLKLLLTAIAILDDLGAVLIIALFYTGSISALNLGIAAAIVVVLAAMNRMGVVRLLPYLLLGLALWFFVLRSGVHATIAGVVLALTIPLHGRVGRADDLTHSPLHRLEHGLHHWVAFVIVPVFGFANAGVALGGAAQVDGVALGIAAGLFFGKLTGIFGAAWIAIRAGLADMPMGATWPQMLGVAALCGIGFTMSLFIGLLAFPDAPDLQQQVKLGILAGSLLSGLVGFALLRFAPREVPVPGSAEWKARSGQKV